MLAMQLELYPSATEADMTNAKLKLRRYRKNKAIVTEFERRGIEKLAQNQLFVYNTALSEVDDIDRAIRLILDPEVREMIEYKYTRGSDRRRHKDTLNRFSNWDQSTVGRKLDEGIESIAESIKLFES